MKRSTTINDIKLLDKVGLQVLKENKGIVKTNLGKFTKERFDQLKLQLGYKTIQSLPSFASGLSSVVNGSDSMKVLGYQGGMVKTSCGFFTKLECQKIIENLGQEPINDTHYSSSR